MKKRIVVYLSVLFLPLLLLAIVSPSAAETTQQEGTGTICVNAFADENGNGAQDANEGYIAGVTFTVGNSDELVGQALSSGTDEPVCFEGVQADTPYQVSQLLPNRLEMTTASNTTVSVPAGDTIGVQFGSRIRMEEPAPALSEPETGGGETAVPTEPAPEEPADGLMAYSGIAVIIVGVALLGGLLFLLLRRQTA